MTAVNNVECVHHWILPSPNGEEYVQGYCKKCGAKSKPHRTYFDETWGFNSRPIHRVPKSSRKGGK